MNPSNQHSKNLNKCLSDGPQVPSSGRWSRDTYRNLDVVGIASRPHQRMGANFENTPVFDHLRNIAEKHPDKLAISDGTNRLTYFELFLAVETLSRRVTSAVPDGQPVGILQASSVWYPVAMLAGMAAGRLLVLLNARDPGARIHEIVVAARLSAVIGEGSVAQVGLTQQVKWIDVASVEPIDTRTLSPPLPRSVSVDAPAIVLYTSGSTGRPKGIVNSQRSLLRRVQQYVDACHINSEDVFLPLAGPATIAGCREVLAALLSGATLHLLEIEAVGLRAVRSRMQAEGVTVTYLVPALLRALMADTPADAFMSLRVARIGGEKASWSDIAVLRKAVSDACQIQVGYSSTETTGSQWFLPRNWLEEGTSVPVGWLLPGITFAIVDEEGAPVHPGEIGELRIRSRYVLLGHWEDGAVVPAESDPDDPNLRIFATGDLVRLDEDGLLHIIGRKGRQIKINGRRVEPAELERVLRCGAGVADAVVIVTAANELVAFAVPGPSARPAFADELRQIITETLPPSLRPLRIHKVAEIPRLSGGKINLAKLAEMDRSVRMSKPVPAPQSPRTESEVKAHQVVQHAWTKVLNTRVAAGNWNEAGGDSLTLLHCIMEIEGLVGRELDLEAFTIGMSVEAMVQAIVSAQADDPVAPAGEHAPPILFLLPGSVGYGPSMAAFAAAMGKVARVAPIRYPDLQMMLGGQDTLSAMAAAAIEQIRRTQPSGNLRLLGHSLGGAVAFEVASRLLAAGRPVKFLGVLDTCLVDEPRDYRETLTRTFHRIRTNRITTSRMACRALAKITVAMGCEARLAWLIERYTRGKFNATCFRIKLELQEVMRARAFFAWLAGPRQALPITGTLFRCDRKGLPQALGWDSAFASLVVVPIAGGHIDLVVEPHLATNHPLIQAAVAQSYSPREFRKIDRNSPAPDFAMNT